MGANSRILERLRHRVHLVVVGFRASPVLDEVEEVRERGEPRAELARRAEAPAEHPAVHADVERREHVLHPEVVHARQLDHANVRVRLGLVPVDAETYPGELHEEGARCMPEGEHECPQPRRRQRAAQVAKALLQMLSHRACVPHLVEEVQLGATRVHRGAGWGVGAGQNGTVERHHRRFDVTSLGIQLTEGAHESKVVGQAEPLREGLCVAEQGLSLVEIERIERGEASGKAEIEALCRGLSRARKERRPRDERALARVIAVSFGEPRRDGVVHACHFCRWQRLAQRIHERSADEGERAVVRRDHEPQLHGLPEHAIDVRFGEADALEPVAVKAPTEQGRNPQRGELRFAQAREGRLGRGGRDALHLEAHEAGLIQGPVTPVGVERFLVQRQRDVLGEAARIATRALQGELRQPRWQRTWTESVSEHLLDALAVERLEGQGAQVRLSIEGRLLACRAEHEQWGFTGVIEQTLHDRQLRGGKSVGFLEHQDQGPLARRTAREGAGQGLDCALDLDVSRRRGQAGELGIQAREQRTLARERLLQARGQLAIFVRLLHQLTQERLRGRERGAVLFARGRPQHERVWRACEGGATQRGPAGARLALHPQGLTASARERGDGQAQLGELGVTPRQRRFRVPLRERERSQPLAAGHPLEIRGEAVCVRIAIVRIFVEQLVDDARQSIRHLGAQCAHVSRARGGVELEQHLGLLALKWRVTHEALEDHAAEGVEVGATIDPTPQHAGLLWGAVGEAASDARGHCSCIEQGEVFGDAEVSQARPGTALVEQHIAGLQVAMHDATRVGFGQCVAQIARDAQGLVDRERTVSQPIGKRAEARAREQQVLTSIGRRARGVERRDAGTVEPRQKTSLVSQHRAMFGRAIECELHHERARVESREIGA